MIAALAGVGAGLALGGAYVAAPYAGVSLTPASVMVAAAVVVFGSSITLLTFGALGKQEKKKEIAARRISDLGRDDFAHFPTSGARIVLRPDSVIEELDVVRNPSSYTKKDVFVTIKKSSGKSVFNPVLIKNLFGALKNFENFLHILLVNEHDEYIGYIPAAYARMRLVGPGAETLIVKYIIDVLATPREKSIDLREINGLSIDEKIFDSDTVASALKKTSEGLFRGFTVFKDKRNRKPIGVIYEGDLIKANMKIGD
ncbi:MAG: hypothetical protein KGJ79_06465 [Alphaproteobacteria bacterium]|nr:hypothetical protein [Alphaproteobacteria bacterium]MDE2110767.1 hypothetical protein [Alphaproteobacteria bacterium]MDE2494572.1 hypothetical protein [Alphaproteobacteria bacterium]